MSVDICVPFHKSSQRWWTVQQALGGARTSDCILTGQQATWWFTGAMLLSCAQTQFLFYFFSIPSCPHGYPFQLFSETVSWRRLVWWTMVVFDSGECRSYSIRFYCWFWECFTNDSFVRIQLMCWIFVPRSILYLTFATLCVLLSEVGNIM